jgi:hypothetical protein
VSSPQIAASTSPTDGATFHTKGPNSILADATFAATRDTSGCPVSTVWRIYRKNLADSLGFLPIVQGVENSLTATGPVMVGDYQVHAASVCDTNNTLYSNTVTIHVVPGPAPPPGGTPPPPTSPPTTTPPPDTTSPVASHVTISQPVLTIFGKPVLVFRWDSSEPTKAKITLERVTKGISVARCAKPRNGRHGKPCKLYKPVGSLSSPLGATSKSFNGKLHGHWLAEGSYRATLLLTDAAGNASKAKYVSFQGAQAQAPPLVVRFFARPAHDLWSAWWPKRKLQEDGQGDRSRSNLHGVPTGGWRPPAL